MIKIAIIGGGSGGLFAAKMLSTHQNIQVCLFEKNEHIASKLRASGGGKANILNRCIQSEHYNNSDFMNCFLQKVNYKTIYKVFSDMGLKMSVDEENRVYPSTFFSMTVLDVLLNNLSPHIQILCNYNVQKLTEQNGKWKINDYPTLFDKVILSTGSPANIISKNLFDFENYLHDLKLTKRDYIPSLVGFKIKNYPNSLFGCKAKAEVTLFQERNIIHREKGEVVFKEDGISGIVILNISSYYNRLKTKNNCSLSLNFLFDDNNYNIDNHLKKHHQLCGLLHPKLNKLYMQHPFDLRDFKLEIAELYGLESAQVCSGGIDLDEINENFELNKYPNLYVIGEMLDIDGVCGGYNLFFAFASAYTVVKDLI